MPRSTVWWGRRGCWFEGLSHAPPPMPPCFLQTTTSTDLTRTMTVTTSPSAATPATTMVSPVNRLEKRRNYGDAAGFSFQIHQIQVVLIEKKQHGRCVPSTTSKGLKGMLEVLLGVMSWLLCSSVVLMKPVSIRSPPPGNHGIIASKRCDHLLVEDNISYENGGSGIMLHVSSDDSIVRGVCGASCFSCTFCSRFWRCFRFWFPPLYQQNTSVLCRRFRAFLAS